MVLVTSSMPTRSPSPRPEIFLYNNQSEFPSFPYHLHYREVGTQRPTLPLDFCFSLLLLLCLSSSSCSRWASSLNFPSRDILGGGGADGG